MINDLVRPIGVRIVCDTYTCNNMADYEIGHRMMPARAFHLCRDCIKTVISEGQKLLGEETLVENNANAEKDERNYGISEESTEEIPGQVKVEEILAEQKKVTKKEESEPKGRYVCKKCGMTYMKPRELSSYKAHVLRCKGTLNE